jgi:hypothetical protein
MDISQGIDGDDAGTELLIHLRQVAAENSVARSNAEEAMPAVGYAVPMIADCAEVKSNRAVGAVPPPWGSANFSGLFRNLLSILYRTIAKVQHNDDDFRLFFNSAQELDPHVENLLEFEQLDTIIQDDIINIIERRKTVSKDGGSYRLSISDSRRRSALTLLREKASYLSYSKQERQLFTALSKRRVYEETRDHERIIRLTLQLDLRDINFLRKGLPNTWSKLLSTLGIVDADIPTFLAFTLGLPDIPFRWHKSDTLFELIGKFVKTFKRPAIPRAGSIGCYKYYHRTSSTQGMPEQRFLF